MPLSLSDDEYAAVMQAAAPIVPSDRGLFLESLAEALARHPICRPGAGSSSGGRFAAQVCRSGEDRDLDTVCGRQAQATHIWRGKGGR
jgi:hypothetical protein